MEKQSKASDRKQSFGRKKEFTKSGKPSYSSGKKYSDNNNRYGEKKTFEKSDRPYNKNSRSENGDKRRYGEKTSFSKSGNAHYGDRKEFVKSDRTYNGDRKIQRNSSYRGNVASDNKNFNGSGHYNGARNGFAHKSAERSNGFRSGARPIKREIKQTETKKDNNDILDTRIEIALQSLIDVEKNGKYINLAFKHNDKLDKLEKKDRAYVMRILYGVTEKSFTVNWLLQKVLKEKRVKPWLNAILRIGVYQIYYMRIDDKDAIAQANALCRKYVSDELCGFVTAVLNKLSENKDEYNPELYRFKTTTERLSVIYSYPEWLIDMWMADYGADTVNLLLNNDFQRAINLRISSKASKDDIIAELDEAKIKYSDGILYNTVSVSDTVNIESLNAYRNGLVTAQGIGSMLTVDVLDVKRNSSVLDACAAPGGKTFYIAEKTSADTESCDIHEHRVELIKKGAERLALGNINAVCRDMTVPEEKYTEAFDRVLIDAPCSGLGMINSKPDIKNNATPEELAELAKIQAKLLDVCSAYVKHGGLLVYSTCTVSKQENEINIKNFISSHSEFELIDIDSKIPDMLNYITEEKTVTILPSKYNADAFFIAALRRI